jgi:FtsH-binding integral membrane protein
VVAVAVLSHWFLDLIVHTPDLPLVGDSSLKLGFGLWNNNVATYGLEALFLIGGLWLYLKSTKGETKIGRYGMIVYVVVLLLLNILNIFGPLTDDNVTTLVISALASYLVFAGIAFWLDQKRDAKE